MERGDVYFSLYQKGRGTDTVLSQVQSLGLRTKTFNISDLRKTLSTQITSLQAESVLQRSPLEKKGRGTDPAIAVSSRKKGAWHGPSDSGLHAVLSVLATQDRN